MNILKKLILLLCLVLFTFDVEAKSRGGLAGKGHSGDIVRTLGLNLAVESQRAFAAEITKRFAEFIDSQQDANNLNFRIKAIIPKFTWGQYTHRIFFHWGFNGDPRQSYALNDQFQKSEATPLQIEKAWNIIIQVQAERNSSMMDVVRQAISQKNKNSCCLSHDEVNALASIIYDVHILGDYVQGTEITLLAIQPFEDLLGDIITATRKLGSKDYKTLNLVKNDINRAKMSGNPGQKAEKVLAVLEQHIPQLIKSSPRMKASLY